MKINEMFPLIYCINLKNRPDRWDKVQKEFKKIGIISERFDAIENKENPVYGCSESHIEILTHAEKQNKNVLIFEDDVEFINVNNNEIEKAVQELSKTEWEIFFLGGNILRPAFQISKHLARLSQCYSAHAYGINANFITFLKDAAIKKRNYPIDVIYGDLIVPNIRAYITIPMFAIQSSGYSNIEKKEMDYSVPMQRYEHFVIKDPKFAP